MLRRGWGFRRERAAETGSGPTTVSLADAPLMAEAAGASHVSQPEPRRHRPRITGRRISLALLLLFIACGGAVYSQRSTLSPRIADTGRNVLGDEKWARVESWYFSFEDRSDKLKYRLFGGDADPFIVEDHFDWVAKPEGRTYTYYVGTIGSSVAALAPDIFMPPPLQLPKTTPLRDNPEAGEGVWSTAGLPHSSPTDILMAKTFIKPDRSRPYASVGVLLIDSRRIRLNITGGTVDPGGDRGVRGPGVIAPDMLPKLLVAWNGGFKGPHGGYGMVADGKEYRPLRNGLATICSYKDGSIRMGEWGNDLAASDTITACRQNAVLLVKDGQVSKRTSEGNDTWGYVEVNSSEFITWRSAVGMTQDGSLMVATGNSLSAATLAQALRAAGAYTAMQLDINNPYVLLGEYYQQPDGTLKYEKFMDSMSDSPSRFLKTQERDFMYVTLDESHWR